MKKIIGAILLICCSACFGQTWYTSPSVGYHACVVRIETQEARARGQASGTFIGYGGGQGLVLTNAHVVKDIVSGEVVFSTGGRTKFRVVGQDRDSDLALIQFPVPEGDFLTIPLAEEAPTPGTTLEIIGWGHDDSTQNLRHFYGEVERIREVNLVNGGQYDYIELRTSVVSGDSGGAVVNASGELVGVIYGGQNRKVGTARDGTEIGLVYPAEATNIKSVRKFLTKYANCQGGKCVPRGVPIITRPQVPITPRPQVPVTPEPELPQVRTLCPKCVETRNMAVANQAAIAALREQCNTIAALREQCNTYSVQWTEWSKKYAHQHTSDTNSPGLSPRHYIGIAGLAGLSGLPGVLVGLGGWGAAKRVRAIVESKIRGQGGPANPFQGLSEM